MSDRRAVWRLFIVAFLLFAAAAIADRAARHDVGSHPPSIERLPMSIGAWRGYQAPPFSDEVLAQLGVDDYVNRVYVAGTDALPVSLYVGYYRSQRAGDTMHSPQNCLPGAGWLPVSTTRITIPVDAGRRVTINRLIIEKGLERQAVLYWYQSRGRVVASEYWSKAYLVYDTIRENRSDAAMVRVIAPVLASDADEAAAEARAVEFVQETFPAISRLLPA